MIIIIIYGENVYGEALDGASLGISVNDGSFERDGKLDGISVIDGSFKRDGKLDGIFVTDGCIDIEGNWDGTEVIEGDSESEGDDCELIDDTIMRGALVGSCVVGAGDLVGAGVGDLVGADVIALQFVTPCSPTPAISNPILQPHKYCAKN